MLLWTSRHPNISAFLEIKQAETPTNATKRSCCFIFMESISRTSELASPRRHPFTSGEGLYSSSAQIRQQPSSHTNASYFHFSLSMSLLWGLCQSSMALWVKERKGPKAAKSTRWLGNNGTPCVILTAPRTPDILRALILCYFYLSDHGCLLQLLVSALALKHWDDLTNMVAPLAKRMEKKGQGNERNA